MAQAGRLRQRGLQIPVNCLKDMPMKQVAQLCKISCEKKITRLKLESFKYSMIIIKIAKVGKDESPYVIDELFVI